MTAEFRNSKNQLMIKLEPGRTADVELPSGRRIKIYSQKERMGFRDSDNIQYNANDKLWLMGDNFVLAK